MSIDDDDDDDDEDGSGARGGQKAAAMKMGDEVAVSRSTYPFPFRLRREPVLVADGRSTRSRSYGYYCCWTTWSDPRTGRHIRLSKTSWLGSRRREKPLVTNLCDSTAEREREKSGRRGESDQIGWLADTIEDSRGTGK